MKQHNIMIERYVNDLSMDISLDVEDTDTRETTTLETHEIVNSVTEAYRIIDFYRDQYEIFKIIEIVRDENGSAAISENITPLIVGK